MKLIVGLGNPEPKYAKNRHNIGFWLLDAMAGRDSQAVFQAKFKGLIAKTQVGGESALLLKPQTYMNLSGESVRAAMDFYKLTPDDVWVVHDDLDLAPLKLRFKRGGGDGGHNGLKSITQHLGTAEYWRVRLGIGHPGEKSRVSSYVLSDFSTIEEPHFEDMCRFLAPRMSDIMHGKGNDVAAQWTQSPVFTLRTVKA